MNRFNFSTKTVFFLALTYALFSFLNSSATTYTWNNTNGGAWTTTSNWTPASPAGGPANGSDIIIPALSNNTRSITAIPSITLASLTFSNSGTSWLVAASSGNTITVSGSWLVPASHTMTIGASGARLCWMLTSASTASISGYVAFDAGTTNRNFEIYGTLIVNANGCIYDPNPTGGSDFYFYAGCTLKTQKSQGFTTTAATSTANINYSVAVCTGGSYSYITGINFEYNGVATQSTGAGLSQNTASNVVISNTTGVVILSGNLKTSGDLTIASNATLNVAALSCSIGATTGAGDLINNGTFSTTTGTVMFNGNGAQTLSGTSTSNFYNFTLNNTNGVTLLAPINVSGALTLTLGKLFTSTTNILTLQNGATAPVLTAASTSYVDGPVKCQKNTSGATTLNFPVGKGSDCRPIQLAVSHGNTTMYNYVGELFNASARALTYTYPASIDTVSNTHYWDITRTDNSSVNQPTLDLSSTQTVRLCFGANDGVKNLGTLRVVKNTFTASTAWTDLTGGSTGGTITNGNITSVGFTSFSRFTLAGSTAGINPLPISLIDFTSVCQGGGVQLNWATASENNNKYFLIERSTDGLNWNSIAQVKGQAQSTTKNEYSYTDDSNPDNLSYYRLSQVDADEKIAQFKTIAANCDKRSDLKFVLYPNPSSSAFDILVNASSTSQGNTYFKIMDGLGRILVEKQIELSKGTNTLSCPLDLESGCYNLILYSDDVLLSSQKLVITKL